ncbi:MAG: ATP-binding protein [Clostridiales bacterium]|nr:ATP-binding protein [Clostridiales bacterium]
MDKMLISLKNIYRLLMIQDFPVYSEAVFSEKNRRGLTLVKFWQTYLAEDFYTGKYGKMIWRSEGKRNRHISSVINRTGTRPAYDHYEAECVGLLTPQVLKRQQQLFAEFLKKREFSKNAFIWKMKAYLNRLEEEPYLDQDSALYLQNFYNNIVENGKDEDSGISYSAWMLTMLTVFALAGSRMGILRDQTCLASFFPETAEAEQLAGKRKKYLKFLTKQTGELSRKPLPSQHFFGRERELFELRQMVLTGGHYLISGMGGIGKTELLRQLLRLCAEENLCDTVALISYENSMAMSFVAAFGETGTTDLKRNFMEILGRIRLLKNKRVLILIDNMNHTAAKDQGLQELLDLPATILATSRVREIPGFTTFEIKSLSADAGSLIFRDHYGKILTEENKEALSQILDLEGSRHPLTLRFLGRTAGYGNWSVKNLKDQFVKDSGQIFKEGKSVPVFLGQIYEHIYHLNHLSRKERQVLDIYTRLPYSPYSGSFLREFFMELTESETQVESRLRKLCWLGFLEESGKGFSMHPFIAECLGNRSGEWEDYFFERVLERLLVFLEESEGGETVYSEDGRKSELPPDAFTRYLEGGMLADTFIKSSEIGEICRMLLYYEKKMPAGERSERQMGTLLMAIEATGRIYGFSEEMYLRLVHFRREYPGLPLAWRLRCLIMEADSRKTQFSEYEQTLQEYEQHRPKDGHRKELYEYFCVAYMRALINDGKFDKALECGGDFFDKIENPKLKMEISKYMVKVFLLSNAYDDIVCWLTRSEKLLSPESDKEMYREFLMQKGRYYFQTEQWDLFRNVQAELCRDIQEKDVRWQYDYFYWQGMMEFTIHQDEKAVKSLDSSRDYARAYFGRNHVNVGYVDQALGVCFANMAQYEKAFFYTAESRDIFARYPGEKGMERRLRNNIGHLNMRMGKLTEALDCLTDVYQEIVSDSEERDTVIMAQICDNLAKTYHGMENAKEERRWLTEAIEYMEQAFGIEHEVTKEAKERLGQCPEA